MVSRWVGVGISIFLVAWLFISYDTTTIAASIRNADYRYFFLLPEVLLANFILRTLRWRLIIPSSRKISFGSVFMAQMIGYLSNNIMPARAGEVVKLYLISHRERLSKSVVLATMVVEKVADLLITVALLALVLIVMPAPAWVRKAGMVVGLIAFALSVALFAFHIAGPKYSQAIQRLLFFIPAKLLGRIVQLGRDFNYGISNFRDASRGIIFTLYSALIWGTELLIVILVAKAFSLNLDVISVLFVFLAIAVGTMVPSSPGYLGTFEYFGLSALTIIGITGPSAAGFVVTLHAVSFLGTSLVGALCVIPIGFSKVIQLAGENSRRDAHIPANQGMESRKPSPSEASEKSQSSLPVRFFLALWIVACMSLYEIIFMPQVLAKIFTSNATGMIIAVHDALLSFFFRQYAY
jgi:uncharacterized protein (TIRG00374 family)